MHLTQEETKVTFVGYFGMDCAHIVRHGEAFNPKRNTQKSCVRCPNYSYLADDVILCIEWIWQWTEEKPDQAFGQSEGNGEQTAWLLSACQKLSPSNRRYASMD
jgi:hypothetical protein